MGAAAGGALGSSLGNSVSGAKQVQSGAGSTPTGANANKANYGISTYSKGGYACYADGGIAHDHAICMKLGGHIAGHAPVEGDSEQNDTVPALLSPGELVIPRSVPKDGPHMEEFARNAPVGGDKKKKVDLTGFTKGYRKGR